MYIILACSWITTLHCIVWAAILFLGHPYIYIESATSLSLHIWVQRIGTTYTILAKRAAATTHSNTNVAIEVPLLPALDDTAAALGLSTIGAIVTDVVPATVVAIDGSEADVAILVVRVVVGTGLTAVVVVS